ncbi:MAG: hypothetical protein RLZZ210_1247 [Pseudomonadota bacterium]|jgi:sulfofructose kinase
MNDSIIFLGGCTLDKVWMVNNLPQGGFKSKAYKYFEVGGGMAANAAVAASRLGANAHFWGRAGNDIIGKTIKTELENYNINCQYFKLVDGACSPVSAVIVDDNGERMIINHSGNQLSQTPAWLPLYKLQDMQAVQVDTRWVEGAKTVLEHARVLNIPTILDAEKTPVDVFEQILPHTDYAIFSETGLMNFAKDNYNIEINQNEYEILAKILQNYACKVVAVTKGKDGVMWLDRDEILHKNYQPSFKVKVIDTTGAGDVFHGAFTYAIANKYTTQKAMEFASATAALKCTHVGGRGVPDLLAVEEFIKNYIN